MEIKNFEEQFIRLQNTVNSLVSDNEKLKILAGISDLSQDIQDTIMQNKITPMQEKPITNQVSKIQLKNS